MRNGLPHHAGSAKRLSPVGRCVGTTLGDQRHVPRPRPAAPGCHRAWPRRQAQRKPAPRDAGQHPFRHTHGRTRQQQVQRWNSRIVPRPHPVFAAIGALRESISPQPRRRSGDAYPREETASREAGESSPSVWKWAGRSTVDQLVERAEPTRLSWPAGFRACTSAIS